MTSRLNLHTVPDGFVTAYLTMHAISVFPGPKPLLPVKPTLSTTVINSKKLGPPPVPPSRTLGPPPPPPPSAVYKVCVINAKIC